MKKGADMKTILIILLVLIILGSMGALGYHLAFHPLLPKVDKTKKHIACIGDSITYGAGVGMKHNTQSYPAYLQKLVSDECQVLNYGISGRTLLDEGDMPYTKEKQFNASLDVKADIYIIMLGTNDSKPHNWNKAGNKFKEELIEFLLLKNISRNMHAKFKIINACFSFFVY